MRSKDTRRVHIATHRESVRLTGDVCHSLRMSLDSFIATLPRLPTERAVDLIYIVSGVYATDRIIKRTIRGQSELVPRDCDLAISVRDLDFWEQPCITRRIEDLIYFLTGEIWTLRFEAAPVVDGENRHQHPLRFPALYQPERVALYSGGLDSAAGLANQITAGIDRYVLVTIGHQSWIRRRTRQQLSVLQESLGARPLMHSVVLTNLRGHRRIKLSEQERSQRARSLLFASYALAVANAFGLERIDVFENGIGSINFPLMTGALFGGLTTRGSHPTFLRHMSELGSAVLERPVKFALPFAAMSKAQMLKSLCELGLEPFAQSSCSCIHTSLRRTGKSHCGVCPGCIERRQAFVSANVADDKDSYSIDVLGELEASEPHANYLRLYVDEALAWLKGDVRQQRRLTTHLRLTGIPESEDERIARLHTVHCGEVVNVYQH